MSVCVCETASARPGRAGARAGGDRCPVRRWLTGMDMRARAGAGCPRTSLQPRAQHAPARRDTVLERPRHYTNDWGWGVTLIHETGNMDVLVDRTASASPQQARRGGRIRPCVLSWKYTRLRPRADRLSGTAWQAQRGDQAQRPSQVGLHVCTRAGSVSAWSHRCCHG